ncbi:MAG: hypothetical protein M3Q56_05210 [Bacteroidota bacterium]|nr:hypothetical protein [Bacteroidota bacterium]
MKFLFWLLFISFLQPSCTKKEDISNIPTIEFKGLSKKSMKQGALNEDSLFLKFSFKDGDGDLGYGSTNPQKDIVVIDKRTGLIQDQYKLPDLPPSNGNPMSGTAEILIFTTCCLFPQGIPPCESPPQYPIDTLIYELYIRDKSGNESNHILSEFVILNCK